MPQNYSSSHCPAPGGKDADIIFRNGRIYTVEATQEWVESVAIAGGKFIALGSDKDTRHLEAEHTKVIDLDGQFAMPGIYDMHTHPDLALAPGYAGYLEVGIADPTPQQVEAAIVNYAEQNPPSTEDPNGWVYGQYWVRFTFRKAGIKPDKHWLDSIIPDRPAAILDRSWGCILVNSKALELAGISADTADPSHGYIERDGLTGEPTGILVDGAYAMIHAAMPPTPQHALRRAYRDMLQFQASRGVVGSKYVHVCEHRLDALKSLDMAGELSQRIEASISWQDDIFPVKRRWQLIAGERFYYHSNRLNPNSVKFHFDGTHESRSTYLSTPWEGETDWRGHLNMTPEHLRSMLLDTDNKGIRVIAHCTGDGASDIFLDAVAWVRNRTGRPGVRHQVAHSTTLLDENLPRFAALNVTAEFSPVGWMPTDFATQRVVFGEERKARMYNFKGVLDSGGNAVMGTDWPVTHPNLWGGFEGMITRQVPWTDDQKYFPGEAISVTQAIEVMTINGARSMEIEDSAGSIAVGKSADMIVLDRNLLEVNPRGNIYNTQVQLTLLEGKVIWDSEGRFADTHNQALWQDAPDFGLC